MAYGFLAGVEVLNIGRLAPLRVYQNNLRNEILQEGAFPVKFVAL